jgi:hypothetical protein
MTPSPHVKTAIHPTRKTLCFIIIKTEFLAANPEVPGSIPGATRFSE